MNDVSGCLVAERPLYPFRRDLTHPFDPAPEMALLRHERPMGKVVLWNGKEAWLVSKLDDARAVLGSHKFSSVPTHENYPMLSPGVEATKKQDASFIRKDRPVHTEHRRMWQPFFNVKNIAALRPGVQQVVDQAIENMIAAGPPADFVSKVALDVPSRVISHLMAVPDEDHKFFQKHSAVRAGINPTPDEISAANHALEEYWWRMVKERMANPGDDLVSRLIVTQVKEGIISEQELVAMAQLMLFAGHDTTANMIGLGTLVIIRTPGMVDRIRNDPAITPKVVEELLRYLSVPHNGLQRVALEDVEIGGRLVKAGDGIIIHLASANRDEAHFADPDAFDPDRQLRTHVAFGAGAHACLGAPLARAELQIVFDTLFRRLPDLALAVPIEEVSFKADNLFYGAHALPVTWNTVLP